MSTDDTWKRFRHWQFVDASLGFRLDVSRMGMTDAWLAQMRDPLDRAFAAMHELEQGAIANPDEGRMVGHYWLRDPALAPDQAIREEICSTLDAVLTFVDRVHTGEVRPPGAERFTDLLVVGIGGSALGPQFVADALGSAEDRMTPHFLDNTDPDGIDRVLDRLGDRLRSTLTVVISKSGGTPETRNGMLETQAAYRAHDLAFGPQAVAITQAGSKLDAFAQENRFLIRFPMWDWVGGRTSETSAVGLLPAALQGIDVRTLLEGAAAMDAVTRVADVRQNPAALLALAWHFAGDGRGKKDMVILPYKDRLALLSRYLQQLVMESLGKERDLDGNVVHQGIAVYGNKGSTDQHAYVQQLRDGVPNFFATFIEVLRDRDGAGIEVDPGTTSGDYLQGFLLGTRKALWESDRKSVTITVRQVSPRSVGMLIALYERAVGLYASLVNVNAYNQPGVEAGKRAAAAVLELQHRLLEALARPEFAGGATVEQIAEAAGASGEEIETTFWLLERLAANPERGIRRDAGEDPFTGKYRIDPA